MFDFEHVLRDLSVLPIPTVLFILTVLFDFEHVYIGNIAYFQVQAQQNQKISLYV